MYDVIIVGAGVAGLSNAIKCGESGLKTLILEKDKKITSNGTWWISKEILEKNDLEGCVIDWIHKIELRSLNGAVSIASTKTPKIAVVSRKKVIETLLKRAKSNGCEIATGEKVERVEYNGNSIIINGLKTKICVDASGFPGAVINKFVPIPKDIVVNWSLAWSVTKPKIERGVIYQYMVFDIVDGLPVIGWDNSEGKSMAQVGVNITFPFDKRITLDLMRSELKKYLRWRDNSRKFKNYKVKSEVMSISSTQRLPSVANNIMAVGAAATQTSPTMAGAATALEYSKIASKYINLAIEKENYKTGFLKKYDGEWKSMYIYSYILSRFWRQVVNMNDNPRLLKRMDNIVRKFGTLDYDGVFSILYCKPSLFNLIGWYLKRLEIFLKGEAEY